MAHRPYVAVVGPSDATSQETRAAEKIGRGLAEAGAIVITGGLGGVMAAACHGASAVGGTTVGFLPGTDRNSANDYLQVALPTGLGELRNGLIIRAADAVIAVGGAYGTLSEIALALRTDVPVIGLDTWDVEGIERVGTPAEAVERALQSAGRRPRS
ncbi:MAG TPA: TIGR00725 family protein [Solirubrobacteraceae bacterium]|nr:TIGR00725 family protein [Solirubrobacteraceae bacterium]